MNYRILYFFHGRVAAVLAHALTKEDRIPNPAIEAALTRKRKFAQDATLHTFEESWVINSRGPENQMKRARKRLPTTDAIEIIHRRHYEGHPDRIAGLAEVEADDAVARQIFQLRKRAGLTQNQMADLVGTTTSVISRLEDADYQGHSLTMLRRVAAALNQRLEVRFVQAGRKSVSLWWNPTSEGTNPDDEGAFSVVVVT